MEKWLHVSVCLVLSFTHTAFASVEYLHAQCNASIAFSCVSSKESGKPFAFSLNRSWLNKEEVFYHNFKTQPSVKDDRLRNRITDQTDGNQSVVNISIENLQSYDTDMYECLFHYNKVSGGFQNHHGRSKFFLYVQEPCPNLCTCTLYTPLLFSLSAAAGLLFFIILILTAVHCARTGDGGQVKVPLPIPIYEEMNGVREKGNSHALDDDIAALYVRPKKENPYSN